MLNVTREIEKDFTRSAPAFVQWCMHTCMDTSIVYVFVSQSQVVDLSIILLFRLSAKSINVFRVKDDKVE